MCTIIISIIIYSVVYNNIYCCYICIDSIWSIGFDQIYLSDIYIYIYKYI